LLQVEVAAVVVEVCLPSSSTTNNSPLMAGRLQLQAVFTFYCCSCKYLHRYKNCLEVESDSLEVIYLVPASESCLDVGGPLSSGHAVNFKSRPDDGRYD
jgi:hypothetical protein